MPVVAAVNDHHRSRYHDPGALGPLPDMYEPFWFREKSVAGVAEAVALVTATLGLLEQWWHTRLPGGSAPLP